MKKYIIIICLALTTACNIKDNKNSSNINSALVSNNFIGRDIDTCKTEKLILQDGYIVDSGYFWFDAHYKPEQFPYTLLLANKYNNPFAQEAVSEFILQDFYHPSYSTIVFEDKLVLDLFKVSDSIVTQKHKSLKINNREKDSFFVEIANSQYNIIAELKTKGYFQKKRFTKPDSISFNLAISNLLNAAKEPTDYSDLLNLSMFYLTGYGVKSDLKNSKFWYNRYIDCWLREYSLNNIQERKITHNLSQAEANTGTTGITGSGLIQNQNSIFAKETIAKIKSGDTLIYNGLKKELLGCNSEFELLLFSTIMADRYNYKPAYYDVYNYLWLTFNYNQKRNLWDLSQFDMTTQKYALYHLKKSASFGNKQAISILSQIN